MKSQGSPGNNSTNELRQRRVSGSHSNSATPTKVPSPRLFYEDSPVPGARTRWNGEGSSHGSNASSFNGGGSKDSSEDGGSRPVSPVVDTGARTSMTQEQVKKDERKSKKILVRVVYGACMFGVFAGSVCASSVNAENLVFLESFPHKSILFLILKRFMQGMSGYVFWCWLFK